MEPGGVPEVIDITVVVLCARLLPGVAKTVKEFLMVNPEASLVDASNLVESAVMLAVAPAGVDPARVNDCAEHWEDANWAAADMALLIVSIDEQSCLPVTSAGLQADDQRGTS